MFKAIYIYMCVCVLIIFIKIRNENKNKLTHSLARKQVGTYRTILHRLDVRRTEARREVKLVLCLNCSLET